MSDVVDGGPGAIAAAPGRRDLVLSRQLVAERIGQQPPGEPHHVRGNVEDLVGTDARLVAGGDVADRIASTAFGGQARLEKAHHGGVDALNLHAVHLEILPAGQMQRAVAVLRGHLGRRPHVPRFEDARGQTGPEHEGAGLALLVDALGHANNLRLMKN